jgi:hypothetical protein
MESGIIEIKFTDGSKFNVSYQNRTQKGNMILWYDANKHKVKSFEFLVQGIHTTKDFITSLTIKQK